jgi:hypothetical protein
LTELRDACSSVDADELDAGDLGEVFEMLHGEGLAEAGVVCTTGVDPSCCSDLEREPGKPDSAGYGQLGERLLGLDYVDLVDDHAKTITHIDERGDDGRTIECGEDEANGTGFTADAERMDLERGLGGGMRFSLYVLLHSRRQTRP